LKVWTVGKSTSRTLVQIIFQ